MGNCCAKDGEISAKEDDYQVLNEEKDNSNSPRKRVLFHKIFGDEDHTHPFERYNSRINQTP